MKKTLIVLLSALAALSMALTGCGGDSGAGGSSWGDEGTDGGTYTGSGYEYRADVNEDSASVEYLDATVDIEEDF